MFSLILHLLKLSVFVGLFVYLLTIASKMAAVMVPAVGAFGLFFLGDWEMESAGQKRLFIILVICN